MLLTRPRLVAAGLLLASAAAFATGTALERHSGREAQEVRPAASRTVPPQGEPQPSTTSDGDGDGDEPAGPPASTAAGAGDAGGSGDGGHEDAATEQGAREASERLFGPNPEGTPLVIVATVASVSMAIALLLSGSALLAWAIAVAMAVFAALDIREVVHQLDAARPGLAAIAALVALLHALAAGASTAVARDARRPGVTGPPRLRAGSV